MKTIEPDNRSNDPQRRHLETQFQELTKQYEQLTARIAALDTDIGREMDSERRMVLKQRRLEQSDERDQIGAQIAEIERQLAGAINAAPSRPTVPGHPSTGSDKTVAPVSRSVLHRYRGFLAAGAGVFVVAILILLLDPLFPPTADMPTTATRTSTPAGPMPKTPIAVTAISEPTVAQSDTLTATPSLTLTVQGDVIITELNASKATRRYEFARRLEDDLQRRLVEYGLTNVTVAVSPQVIGSAEEARSLAEEADGIAVIWGWYDDLDVGIRVELLDEAGIDDLASTTQLPLLPADEQSIELAVVVREVLPQNVSFLSLFVVGHLSYLANNYEMGHRAFDAAMNAMPSGARLDNEALLHFFMARKLENSDAPEDVIAVVCGYADAIQADPAFAPSYNNLANVYSRHIVSLPYEDRPDVSDCLKRAGVGDVRWYEVPVKLYDLALEKQPGWVLAEYNRASYIWNHSGLFACTPMPGAYYCLTNSGPLVEHLQGVQEEDGSFVGTHVILGNLAFENGEYEVAREHFQAALTLAPNDTRIEFNLAQTLRKLDDLGAEDLYRQALTRDDTNYEAALQLASRALENDKPLDAYSLMEKIPRPDNTAQLLTRPESMANIVRAALLFDDDDISATIDQLQELVLMPPDDTAFSRDDSLLHYLLSLLYQIMGDIEASEQHRSLVKTDIASLIWKESYFRVQNASIELTWFEIVEECGSDGLEGDCLPNEIDTRITSLLERVMVNFDERLYYGRGDLNSDYEGVGAACPYVFTIDPATGTWQLDTTILYHLVGQTQEKFQIRSLRNFDGRLLIREVEPEISYIDRLYVLIGDLDGHFVKLEASGPQLEALSTADDHYLILTSGDEVELYFPDYDPTRHLGAIYIVAQGYYEPLH